MVDKNKYEGSVLTESERLELLALEQELENIHPSPRDVWKYRFDPYKTEDGHYKICIWTSLFPTRNLDVEANSFLGVLAKAYAKLVMLEHII